MENRDRDKLSRNSTGSTEAGDINRNIDESTSEFGRKIGQSENLEKEPNRRDSNVGDKGLVGDEGRSSGSSIDRGRNSSEGEH